MSCNVKGKGCIVNGINCKALKMRGCPKKKYSHMESAPLSSDSNVPIDFKTALAAKMAGGCNVEAKVGATLYAQAIDI